MKRTLTNAVLLAFVLGLVLFIAFRPSPPLGWGPEPRTIKVVSVDEISANLFYGSDLGIALQRAMGGPDHYYYKAKSFDIASGVNLRWSLNCDHEIKPPVRMIYTPYGGNSESHLAVHAVVAGPFRDDQEALSSTGDPLPSDEMIAHGLGTAGGAAIENVWVLRMVPVVGGTDFRSVDPGFDQNGRRTVRFTLTKEAGDRFYDYTSKNIGRRMAVVMGGQAKEVVTIQSAIRDEGEITGSFTPDEVLFLSKMLGFDAKRERRTENFGSLANAEASGAQNRCLVFPNDRHSFLRWFN